MSNFETIKLDKGLYTSGKGFTAALEQIDPSENYKGTALEGLDAFERQLKRFNIKLHGAGSDCVEKFFQTTDSAALFPEYIARAVRKGLEEADLLPYIVATKTDINGMDYRTITSVPTAEEKELKETAEGAAIPETVVHTQENLVKLKKRGRMLVASYEALRFQRLDLFTVTLRQIGAYIARTQLKDAVPCTCRTEFSNDLLQKLNIFIPTDRRHKLHLICAVVCITSSCLGTDRCIAHDFPLAFLIVTHSVRIIEAAYMGCGSIKITGNHFSRCRPCDAGHLNFNSESLRSQLSSLQS